MSAQPWAAPGLSPEERARALVAAVAMPLEPEIAEVLRAAEADAYARGMADGAVEAATAAVEVMLRLRADAPTS